MNSLHILIAGIGNPAPYQLTRHSIGNIVIESLARRLNVRLTHARGADMADVSVNMGTTSARVTLYKSGSYMNLSGPPLSRALKSVGLRPTNLIVLHDSLSHKPQAISPKDGGSANGHNGIRSVISALGTDAFHRLRLGIGKNQGDAAEYVLEKLSPAERAFWEDDGAGVDQVWSAIERITTKIQKTS